VQASLASAVGDGVQLSPVVARVRGCRAAGQAVLGQRAQALDSSPNLTGWATNARMASGSATFMVPVLPAESRALWQLLSRRPDS